MRFLLLTILSVLVSCGQDSSSGRSKAAPKDTTPSAIPAAQQNQEYVTDVREVDLLDVAMDVPVEVTGDKIVFKQSLGDTENGLRSTCNVAVTTGEVYSFQVTGTSMVIKTATGVRLNFTRVSGSGNSILGSWSGKTYEGSQLIMRRLTFVSPDRLIMRTHCES